MTLEKFMALRALENQRVQLTFRDGQSLIVRLLSVTSDFDQSQHLVYDNVEDLGFSKKSGQTWHAAGEELVACVGAE